MTRQPSSRREEAATQKDLKKLQQQEQRILAKLAEAREAQANALKRFAEAQARVLLVEGRLQAVRERLQASQLAPAHIQEAVASLASTPNVPEIDAQIAQPAPEFTTLTDARAEITQAEATVPNSAQRDVAPSDAAHPATKGGVANHIEPAPALETSRQRGEQPTDEAELLSLVAEMSASVPIETLSQTGALAAPDVLAEDLEETAPRAALPSAPPAPQEKRPDQEEEDALIASMIALAHSKAEIQGKIKNDAHQAVQRAEQALSDVNQAILNGTLSGSEADNALREAEASVSQARARLAERSPSPESRSSAWEAGAPDITDKLPVMHDRDARTQEPT